MFRYNKLLFTLLVLVWSICTGIDICSAPNIVDCHRGDSIVLKYLAEGDRLYAEGNYPASLGKYIQGLEISERLCDPSLIAIFYKNMGNVYNMSGDGEKALLLYERALMQNSIDTLTKHSVLMNLVRTAISLDNLGKAKKAYRDAVNMKYHRSYMDKFLEGFSHAMIIEKEGKYDRAVKEYVIMADSATKWKIDPRFEIGAYEQIANSFLRRDMNDSALVYMRKYVDIAENTGRTHMFAEGLKQLSKIYASMGEKELSLEIKSRYLDIKDSIFNDAAFHRENNRLQVYEEGKYKDAIDEISRDNIRLSEQNKILILVCLSSIMILGVIMYVIIQKRKLHHSYTILYRLHEQLRSSGSIGYLPMKRTFEESAYTDITQCQIAEDSIEDRSASNEPVRADGSTCDITKYIGVNVESDDFAEISLDKDNKPSGGVKYASSNLSSIKKEKLFERIYSFMEDSEAYCKPDFSLDQLAQAVGSNEKYVSQVINDKFGKNFSSFVNTYRIEMACRRLDGENKYAMLTIKAIGQSVGYKSHSSFVRAFKQIVGMNPSDYQKIAQRNKNQQ